MNKTNLPIAISIFRGARLAVHFLYALPLALLYPHMTPLRKRRTLKNWSRQLLAILNIGIRSEGQRPVRADAGCMIVANHVSWLDVFVLNALYPATFIAKSEVSRWPLIGWLCKRSGTIFIERSVRKNTSTVNKHIASQLEQGICVALFPEGTTSDGRQAGHFHSSLIQPAIEVGAPLYPIALRYLDEAGEQSYATAFTGEMTLVQSIVQILRCRHLDALAIFTPALSTTEQNRRVLARLAQEAISQELHCLQTKQPKLAQSEAYAIPQAIFSTKQDYSLLLESQFNQLIR